MKTIFCIYCGIEISRKLGNETKDHVPPKAFFNNPFPKNLKTVPCCKKCNNETHGQIDEFVSTIFAIRGDVKTKDEKIDKILSMFMKKTPYWNSFFEKIKINNGQPYFNMTPEMLNKINIFLLRLIKGFYFIQTKKSNLENVIFTGFEADSENSFDESKPIEKFKKEILIKIKIAINSYPIIEPSDTIKYSFKLYPENEINHSIWNIKLFDIYDYYILLVNKNLIDHSIVQPIDL